MAAAIGSLTGFSVWRGVYQAPLAPIQFVTRPGVASTGMLVGSARGVPVDVETYLFGTLAECQSHESAAVALHGTEVSCTDAVGSTYAHTLVSLNPAPPEGRITPARGLGGTATHVCRLSWVHVPEA